MARQLFVLSLSAALIVVSTVAQAADARLMMNNMAHEAIECAVFFSIMSGALRNSDHAKDAANALLVGTYAIQWGSQLTEKAGLDPATIVARFKMAEDDMLVRIHSDPANVSILLADYGVTCHEGVYAPEARLEYWTRHLGE